MKKIYLFIIVFLFVTPNVYAEVAYKQFYYTEISEMDNQNLIVANTNTQARPASLSTESGEIDSTETLIGNLATSYTKERYKIVFADEQVKFSFNLLERIDDDTYSCYIKNGDKYLKINKNNLSLVDEKTILHIHNSDKLYQISISDINDAYYLDWYGSKVENGENFAANKFSNNNNQNLSLFYSPENNPDEYNNFSTSDYTLNMFDYWITTEESQNQSGLVGINKDRYLYFRNSGMQDGINTYNKKLPFNYIKGKLSDNGFPIIKEEYTKGNYEDLGYLFDVSAETEFRRKFPDVKNALLHNHQKGDYINSNLATIILDKNTNTMHHYKQLMVAGAAGENQFYPMNTLEQLNEVNSTRDNRINFYFGINFETVFYQPLNGKKKNYDGQMKDVYFEFAGDDDILIFLDDILVSDLGGIHDTLTTKINFATGKVTIKPFSGATAANTFNYYLGEKYEEYYTPEQMAEMFYKETDENDKITKYTYKEYTQHTLKVFYLERGANESHFETSFWPSLNILNKYKVITKANEGGSITGDEIVLEGNDSTVDYIKITPEEGYYVSKITINGENIPITEEMKNGTILPNFIKMTEDKIVEVFFKKEQKTNTISEIIENPNTKGGIAGALLLFIISLEIIILLYIRRNIRTWKK